MLSFFVEKNNFYLVAVGKIKKRIVSKVESEIDLVNKKNIKYDSCFYDKLLDYSYNKYILWKYVLFERCEDKIVDLGMNVKDFISFCKKKC
jgi:hypothetical protein